MKTNSVNPEFAQEHELTNNSENFNYFLNDIQNAYWAENIQLKTFPKWALLANSQELRKSVLDYILLTAGHVQHIENIFEILAQKAKGKIDNALKDVLHRSEILAENTALLATTADSAIIKALCEIVSYQIEIYEKLNSAAKTFKQQSISELIEKTLKEEYEIFKYFVKLRDRISK